MVAPAYVVADRSYGSRLALTMIVTIGTLSISGCSSPVAVQAPPMSAECQDVLTNAPIRLLGELQRETTPSDAAAIAWGDPPIVLTCGEQSAIAPDSQVIEVNGIDWAVQSSNSGTVFTTYQSSPTVQLRVPVTYRPEIDALSELTLE